MTSKLTLWNPGATPKILISILATNPTYILHTMPEDIQERMRALIAQQGTNAPAEFNQDTSESACERHNRL
jgi:hypothetical protein